MGMFMSAVRFLQLVFGLTVLGLYGRDVHHDHENGEKARARWVFALITAFLATLTAGISLGLPFLMSRMRSSSLSSARARSTTLILPRFVWEFVLCVLWLTLFGIFGKMYIGVYPVTQHSSGKQVPDGESTSSSSVVISPLGDAAKINRMRHAVWIDLVNLLMWVGTAAFVLLRWLKSRRVESGDEAMDAEKADQF